VDPLAGSAWSTPSTVDGFVRAEPNPVLLAYAARIAPHERGRLLDIGCGAGRNAIPLARGGWHVFGLDLSTPMLAAARDRAGQEAPGTRVDLALAPMTLLPVRTGSIDFIVAHGIWNLARSAAEFRAGVREAARAARAGAPLFVFTFSRHTLSPEVQPLPGESFVFTQFSGAPQCFLTEAQLFEELEAGGFERDTSLPVTEYNRPRPGALTAMTGPVIYEAAFRRARA
jgi:SAM-dependent methyltransferase